MLDHEWTLKHNTNHISERAHEGRLLPPRLRHQVQQENLLISLRLPRWGIIPCQSWQSGLFAQTNNGFVSHSSPRAEAKVRSAITGREQTNLRLLCRNGGRDWQGLAFSGIDKWPRWPFWRVQFRHAKSFLRTGGHVNASAQVTGAVGIIARYEKCCHISISVG